MKNTAFCRKAIKLAFAAVVSLSAFAASADLSVPKPSCSQGAYTTYVRITWSQVNGAIGYYVYRSGNTDINSANLIAAVTSGSGTSYQDYGVKPGTKYYYWICPVDSNDNMYYSMSRYASGYAKAPSIPAPKASEGKYQGYVRVTWKSVSAATEYYLFYSPSKTRYDDFVFPEGTALSTDVTGMAPLKKYYFWLGAVINDYLFISKVSNAGWRKKVLTIYTPKVVLIPSDASTGTGWWFCTLSGDLIVPSNASCTTSAKGVASIMKYEDLDDDGFCGDVTGKKDGKAYITIKHSKLSVKSKAISVVKTGYSSASAS